MWMGLNASGMHLAHCLFGGQWITTYDAIKNIMYALVQKNGRDLWREQSYTFTSRVSL